MLGLLPIHPNAQLKRHSKCLYHWIFLILGPVVIWNTSGVGNDIQIPIRLYDFLSWRWNFFFPHFLKFSIGCHHMSPVTDFIFNKVLAAVGKDWLVWIRVHVSCYAYSLSVMVQRTICMVVPYGSGEARNNLKLKTNAYIQGSSFQASAQPAKIDDDGDTG